MDNSCVCLRTSLIFMMFNLIWAVLCQLLLDQEGSLKSIKYNISLLITGEYLMVSDVQRTYVQQGLVRATRQH